MQGDFEILPQYKLVFVFRLCAFFLVGCFDARAEDSQIRELNFTPFTSRQCRTRGRCEFRMALTLCFIQVKAPPIYSQTVDFFSNFLVMFVSPQWAVMGRMLVRYRDHACLLWSHLKLGTVHSYIFSFQCIVTQFIDAFMTTIISLKTCMCEFSDHVDIFLRLPNDKLRRDVLNSLHCGGAS